MATTREADRLRAAGKLNATQLALFEPRPAEQLFDCVADPDNVRNLAGDPAHRATLERLRAANRAHLLRIRDTGFMPEPILRELSGVESPSKVGRDDQAYPLGRILDVVDRLQLSASPAPADLKAAWTDPLPSIRFWGALAALRAPQSVAADLMPLLRDTSGSVRLAAAFVMARHGRADDAWPILAAALVPSQSAELRLEALNYITNLPNRPASLRPAIAANTKVGASGEDYAARAAAYLLTLE